MPFSVKVETKDQCQNAKCRVKTSDVRFSLPLFIFPCELVFVHCDVKSAEK